MPTEQDYYNHMMISILALDALVWNVMFGTINGPGHVGIPLRPILTVPHATVQPSKASVTIVTLFDTELQLIQC